MQIRIVTQCRADQRLQLETNLRTPHRIVVPRRRGMLRPERTLS